MNDRVNEVDTSNAETDRDFQQGLGEFGINLDAQFQTPGTDGGTGPEPGNAEPAGMSEAQEREIMQKFMTAGFTMVHDRLCPNYGIQPAENAMLAECICEVVDYYFPSLSFGPLMALVTAAGGIYGDRIVRGVPARVQDVKNPDASAEPNDPMNSAGGAVHE